MDYRSKKGYNPFIPDIRGLEDKIVKVGLELGDMLISTVFYRMVLDQT